jgi:hypothetical protein
MDVNELYRLLKEYAPALSMERLGGGALEIELNEYCSFLASESDNTLELMNGLTHWHMETKEMAEFIIDLLKGNYIFVERRSIFAKYTTIDILTKCMIFEKSKYEKIKHRYTGKKRVRIYSGNMIIQRAD